MPNTKKSWIPAILTKDYWNHALHPKNKLMLVTVTALLLAVRIALSALFIPVGENLRIYFSFIPTSLACFVGGPIFALCYGFSADIIGFIAFPSGTFFPGYTLSSMLGALIYALFLYRQRITILRLFLCKLTINVFVNIILGSLWRYIQFGKGYYIYLVPSAIKNFLLLPLEVFLLYVIFQAMIPILKRMKMIDHKDNIIKLF